MSVLKCRSNGAWELPQFHCNAAAGQHRLIFARAMPGKKRHSSPTTRLTHLDARGRIKMVDIGVKNATRREAIARGAVAMARTTLDAIVGGRLKKGEALAAARLAGIMAAKRTHELIPLCHQIPLEVVEIDFAPNRRHSTLEIQARAVTDSKTG